MPGYSFWRDPLGSSHRLAFSLKKLKSSVMLKQARNCIGDHFFLQLFEPFDKRGDQTNFNSKFRCSIHHARRKHVATTQPKESVASNTLVGGKLAVIVKAARWGVQLDSESS